MVFDMQISNNNYNLNPTNPIANIVHLFTFLKKCHEDFSVQFNL